MAARVGSLLTLSMFCRLPCGRQLDTSNTLWSFHSGFRDLGYGQDMFNHTCTSWGWHIQVANLGTKHLQDLQREHLEMLQECFPEQTEIARATRTARTPIWTAQNTSWHRLFHVLESKREFCFSCQIPFSHATISSSLNLFKHLPNSARPCVKARNIDEHYLLQAWILWKLLEANLKGLQTPATHSYTATLNAHA